MSLLCGDGWDHYPAALLPNKWDVVGTDILGPDAAYARFTDDPLSQGIQARGGFATIGQAALGKNLPSVITGWAFSGLAFRMPTMPSQGYWMPHGVYDIASSGGMKICTLIGADGSLNIGYVTVNNFSTIVTILATGPTGQVVAGTWYTAESGFKVRTTGGGAILRVNAAESGDSYLEYTGNTNRSQGSNYFADSTTEQFTQIRICGAAGQSGGGAYVDIDDFWVCDDVDSRTSSSDARSDTFLGDVRLGILRPNAAGSSAEMTPTGAADNYDCVNDAIPDDETTYVSSDTVGDEDLYEFEDMAATALTVFGLLINARVAKDDATGRTYNSRIKPLGSAASTVATRTSPTGGFTNQQAVSEYNPASGVRWLPSQVNTMQAGLEVVS